MEYITLGRTGLKASVMGLGGGGHSRLGARVGKTEAESVSIVRQAIDAGINFIDTAEAYGTESLVGRAIEGLDRDKILLSTKKLVWEGIEPAEIEKGLEQSLSNLGVDYIDIYHLHAVVVEEYDYFISKICPCLQRLREQGKIRFIGITERFEKDPQHAMLQRALDDDVWDVMMVGFNLLNQSARERVLAKAIEKNVGILNMFAVRKALSNHDRLNELISELIESGQLDPDDIDRSDPLGFLVRDGAAVSIMDVAYRFCCEELGIHVVLSGTSNPDHLRANIESFSRPPLPQEHTDALKKIFQKVDSVSGT
jgi:aryl-alcohol dehydrogenase-like predicted oxidoreductase